MTYEAREKWTVLAEGWSATTPPAAPSHDDVEAYLMRAGREGRILLLGCTPAVRRAAVERGLRVLSVDITEAMLAHSARAVPPSHSDALCQGDWLDLPLVSGSIDVVLGDKVFGNVMPADWPRWLSELRRVLVPRGLFLTRASPHGTQDLTIATRQSFEEARERWLRAMEGETALEVACSGLWEDCMDSSTVRDGLRSGTQQLARLLPTSSEELLSTASSAACIELTREFIRRYWDSRYARWSAYSEQALVDAVAGLFEFRGRHVAHDYPEADRQPVYEFVALS